VRFFATPTIRDRSGDFDDPTRYGARREFRVPTPDRFLDLVIALVANFAEAMAEGRGKAQAKALRDAQTQTFGQAPETRWDN
jgi:hypothetical protein